MSWMRSGTELSQFLRLFQPTSVKSQTSPIVEQSDWGLHYCESHYSYLDILVKVY